MTKRDLIVIVITILSIIPGFSQAKKQEPVLKREVTLYNPYKPTISDVKKRSFLPDMNDTVKVKKDISYSVQSKPFMPQYTVSPIKAAVLQPDPLTKLYKSYLKAGLGNYFTPLAELSITNERSKKGVIGLYARHLSSSGKVKLDNDKKVFAGYMDNDASVFGRKFFKKSQLEGSVDFGQARRYAYGYDTVAHSYSPSDKSIKLGYDKLGAEASFSSTTLDSSIFSYRFDVSYNYLNTVNGTSQHNVGLKGYLATEYNGFYAGADIEYELFKHNDIFSLKSGNGIFTLSPFIEKKSSLWNFKIGFKTVVDNYLEDESTLHLYPDVNFGFQIVPAYINFFAGLSGKHETNDPFKIFNENPYIKPDEPLYTQKGTDHQLIVFTGVKGNNGIGGNYLASINYSMIKDMLFFFNADYQMMLNYGNYFDIGTDDVTLLRIHGEMTGELTDKITYGGDINYYKYTMTNLYVPWNKPNWDAKINVKYNLRDKILAGVEFTGIGSRKFGVNPDNIANPSAVKFETPAHINLNLSAEYRYSKILSFWTRLDNITFNRYYDWAFYPTQRFLFMAGFTYSL